MSDKQELDRLRSGIDECDRQLVELLAKRNQFTAEIGKIKKSLASPLYVPARESSLIAARRNQAEQAGVSADLVEDILRRMMREAYQNQQGDIACIAPELSPVVIVGGRGVMGQLFYRQLIRSGYQVRILDRDNLDQRESILADAKCVIVSVPINQVTTVVASLPTLPKDCLLIDITSIKQAPMNAMTQHHKGPVLGLHPMFGPDIEHWVKQTVVVCQNQAHHLATQFMRQLEIWGCNLVTMDAKKHDEAMQIVQVMRHLTTFVYGQFLSKQTHSLTEIESCSSPIYHLELMMVGRLFAQSPELYSDIMLAQFEDVEQLMLDYSATFAETFDSLKRGDKGALIDSFSEAKTFFADAAGEFLEQSRALLSKANDAKVLGK